MYTLSVFLIGGGQPLAFQFKDELAGMVVENRLQECRNLGRSDGTPEEIEIKDGYGRKAVILMEEIAGWLGGDLAESFKGQIDATMIQERAKVDAMQRAQSDPKLRLAMAGQQGVILPGRQQ